MMRGLIDESAIVGIRNELERTINNGLGTISFAYRSFLVAFKSAESSLSERTMLTRRMSQLSDVTEGGTSTSTDDAHRKRRRNRPSLSNRYTASQISSELAALERNPEEWKELQFLHLSNFPQSKCVFCDRSICFKCGESTWHKGITCDRYLRRRVEQAKGSSNTLATLKWKLNHSKPCPKCSIYINREEGCNKIDCSHCGAQVRFNSLIYVSFAGYAVTRGLKTVVSIAA